MNLIQIDRIQHPQREAAAEARLGLEADTPFRGLVLAGSAP